MKKNFLILIGVIVFLSGCSKLSEYNVDGKNPSDGPASAFFTSGMFKLAENMASSNVNVNNFRLWIQHWQETTYTDESNYDIATRNVSNQWWTYLYRDVLNNLKTSKEKIATQTIIASEAKAQTAMVDVLEVYTYYVLVSTYGNVAYSEALNINNVLPKYDDGLTIYKALVTRLQADIPNLTGSCGSFASADVLYSGNMANWAKFANSLMLKIAVNVADADPAYAKQIAELAAPNAFSSSSESAMFNFGGSTPNTNPLYVDLVQSGRKDFVACKTLVDKMVALSDPRLSKYFTYKTGTTTYAGGKPGASSPFSSFSYFPSRIIDPTMEHIFIDYSDVLFLKAEAVSRGLIGGDAATFYNSAITENILYWGGTATEASTYLALPDVVFSAKPYKEQIGVQKWIANYNKGFDGWVDQRRLDFPVLPAPASPRSGYPTRISYPVNEVNQNGTNVTTASSAIGGDVVTTKLFWDKF